MAVEEEETLTETDLGIGGGGAVDLKDRFSIRVEQPLPQYDSPPARAYVCTEKREGGRDFFALVCDPKHPPRYELVSTMRRINQKGMIRVFDWGVIDWPPEGRRCPVIIYERPRGPRVLEKLNGEIPRLSEEMVARNFIQPGVAALREMYNLGLTHRNIRPTNLFFDSNMPAQSTIKLGECLATIPAFNQPAAYETIECAMAPPSGRGLGTASNDLYAFGVTVLALLIGRSPCSDMDDVDVITAKLNYGSYSAMIQRHRISLTMMEVVRGLLIDDVEERWTLDDLEYWVGGRRLSPKQQAMPARASRSFNIAGQELLTARDVARGFANNWDAAIERIKGGDLDVWLRRSLGDEGPIEAVNTAKTVVSVSGTETDDRLVGRVIIALDPEGPIRFKSFSAMLDGIGTQIALSYTDEKSRQDFTETLRANFVVFALEQMGKNATDRVRYITQIDKMKPFLENAAIGLGIERVIYELNPSLACQSPLLQTEFVYDLTELLNAFERLAGENPDGIGVLVDRHVAAFVASKFKGAMSTELRDLENRVDPAAVALSNVAIMAQVQDQADKPAPNLCAVAIRMLMPAVERFHSRTRRDQVMSKLRNAAKEGELADILAIVNDSSTIESDKRSYQKAVREFVRSILQMQKLAYEQKHRTQLSRALGSEVAAFISLILSVIAIFVMGAFWIFGG